MISRRDFLKTSALAMGSLSMPSLVGCAGGSKEAAPATPTSKSFIGLQTYSVGQELGEDVPAGLAKLKSFGYTDLELAGYREGKQGGIDPAEYKKMCDDAGLKITSAHVGTPSQYKTPEEQFIEEWKKTVEDHVTMGAGWIIDPSMPQCATVDEVKQACERFNKAGEICKAAGIQFGYHNHNNEFNKIATPEEMEEGRKKVIEMIKTRFNMPNPSEEMVNNMLSRGGNAPGNYYEKLYMDFTDPELVMFELDCYWCMIGDQDPCEWIRDYKDRIKMLHIKDRWIIGDSGMMNWPNIFKTAYEAGIEKWFVELEGNGKGRTQMEGVEESAKFLLAAPYVKA